MNNDQTITIGWGINLLDRTDVLSAIEKITGEQTQYFSTWFVEKDIPFLETTFNGKLTAIAIIAEDSRMTGTLIQAKFRSGYLWHEEVKQHVVKAFGIDFVKKNWHKLDLQWIVSLDG